MIDFGIYVHIPFCESKCKYCSFVSFCQKQEVQSAYFFALKNEIENTKIDKKITSIYFGGGTPSAVKSNLICETLELIKSKFEILNSAEVTIECNPNSVDEKKLKAYKTAGFNRISFGGQSFDDEVLKTLGRVHKSKQIFEAVELAKKCGFENISIDLILGVKKFENLGKNVAKLKDLGLTHISAYMLMLEDGTVFFDEVKSKKTFVLSEDESVIEYNKAVKVFSKLGFSRYEISNFAVKDFESKHNQNYWNSGEYYGFGLSSHSYVNGERFFNTASLQKYLQANFEKKSQIEGREKLSQNQKIEEYVMLSLRTKNGIEIAKLKSLGCDILTSKKNELEFLQNLNMIKITKTNIKITANNFGVCSQIILKLIINIKN